MNEPYDPIEEELSALRPHRISSELQSRVAGRLTASSLRRSRRLWGLAIASGLAAACVAGAIYFGRQGNHDNEGHPGIPIHVGEGTTQVQDQIPSVWTYQLALAHSPETVDALLDKQAQTSAEPTDRFERISVFTRSPATLHALLGED